MRFVVALGGNALMERGEAPTMAVQRAHAHDAAAALAPLIEMHSVVITHGNGPQIGLLALEAAKEGAGEGGTLDVLGAEAEGMIGYLIEQELAALLPAEFPIATLLTQTVVDRTDAAFGAPSKPIGPVYAEAEAKTLAGQHGWTLARDGTGWRRAVASPEPERIIEAATIRLLVEHGVTVICAGGGGIPVVEDPERGMVGVEAVVDKDRVSALLATILHADALLILTDVDGVFTEWGTPNARRIREAGTEALRKLDFAAGSMGPKIEASCAFVEQGGRFAAIGRLRDVQKLIDGTAGTRIVAGDRPINSDARTKAES
jgi:carbamate kinase